jgi:small-conductance mechanosensitive channel
LEEWGYLGTAGLLLLAVLAGYILHLVLFKILAQWSHQSETSTLQLLRKYLYYPTRYVVILLCVIFVSPLLKINFSETISHIISILLIGTVATLLIRVIGFTRDILIRNYDLKAQNNLHARKVFTQFRIVERILIFMIVIFAIAIALMTFDRIRQVGVSLLASAGILGIIVGFAAQKSLATVLAGIQIAIAQPIRIDDVVIIEGEWGRVEEITLTYVVLKIWDERRLIVPINYFIDKPFQNWTRSSTELTGSVYLYTDYSVPVEELRHEFNRILSDNNLWDKRVGALQVTNASEKTIEIRMLASSTNSGDTFNLRCQIREHMIGFIQKNYPQSLPRTRMEINKIENLDNLKLGKELMNV